MTLPNPESFFGKKCLIKLKTGRKVIKTVDSIDVTGVILKENDGTKTTLPFADVDEVALAR